MKNKIVFKVLSLIVVFLIGFSFNSLIVKNFAQGLNLGSTNVSEISENSTGKDVNFQVQSSGYPTEFNDVVDGKGYIFKDGKVTIKNIK